MNILVSGCLSGEKCKYNGEDNLNKNILKVLEGHNIITVCPEVSGGLPTPRVPSEIKDGRVINARGEDVTNRFSDGAEAALRTAKENSCRIAVLKSRSPSCGKDGIYDGTFSGTVTDGDGITAGLLLKNGIEVYREDEAEDLRLRLGMKETSLIHIEKDGKVLLMHRTRKKNDYNAGKWIGVGGKPEPGETPEECAVREVKEETGLTVHSLKKCGTVMFFQPGYGEVMHVYKTDDFSGVLTDCTEGELQWVEKEKMDELPMWEGDRVFLPLMETDVYFYVKLFYEGDNLVRHEERRYRK